MDSKKPEPTIIPGITEALHPGVGNGVALESDKHAFLLRVPDPSKYLETYFGLKPEDLEPLRAASHLPEAKQEIDLGQQPEETAPESEILRKPEVKSSTEEEHEKAPKTGKRLKKAVKSIQREESVDPELKTMETKTESTLSPFTQWLKGLSGSEYVHPYDDDFALRQESPLAGEGISETYADLLAAQGYKDQAIEMYKRLIEKYPEKSGFFAAKIEALS
jgi:tetratricopeptide (TPR) repeat protein